jgi:hypothetical protein
MAIFCLMKLQKLMIYLPAGWQVLLPIRIPLARTDAGIFVVEEERYSLALIATIPC